MKTTVMLLTLISAIALSAVISGCTESKAAPTSYGTLVGAPCKIQFKRDLLGGNTALPIGPETDGINGAQLSLNGKFVRFHEDWIVLDGGNGEVWVPRNVVLLMKFSPK